MRVATAVIVIIGGSVLMYWLHALTLVSGLVYLALAAVCFFGTPWYMRRKVVKNTERILKNANNKQLAAPRRSPCVMKTLSSRGRTRTAFTAMTQCSVLHPMTRHYFIFVDEFSAIIVPFEAFSSMDDQRAFYERITKNISDPALKC